MTRLKSRSPWWSNLLRPVQAAILHDMISGADLTSSCKLEDPVVASIVAAICCAEFNLDVQIEFAVLSSLLSTSPQFQTFLPLSAAVKVLRKRKCLNTRLLQNHFLIIEDNCKQTFCSLFSCNSAVSHWSRSLQ